METTITPKRRGLNFGQALIFGGLVLVLYRVFRSPELDRQIRKAERSI